VDGDSKAYSWAWVTGDRKLTDRESELVAAYLVVSAASTDSAIYNGADTSGDKILDLKSAAITNLAFEPPVPIYCSKGIFVDVGTNVSGILVLWRNLEPPAS
jgi:hypothetical protein